MTAPTPQSAEDLLVALFRLWADARQAHANPFPSMHAHAASSGAHPELVPACESCFTLTQACIGRCLHPATRGSLHCSHDEGALLLMIRHASSAGPVLTVDSIPHGLPGALCWANFAVARALGDRMPLDGQNPPSMPQPVRACPFGALATLAA